MNAAARIFLHIRSLRRGVCVLNCCNNSLFMLRQSAFGHEGLSHLTCNMLWCMMHYTCGGEGVYFGGSWVASCSSPLPRRGRGAATDLHVVNIVAFFRQPCDFMRCTFAGDVCPSYAKVTRKSVLHLHTSQAPSCIDGFLLCASLLTNGP